jgi:hypothetical protein
MSTHYIKVPQIDEERLDNELILLHPETLQVKVLNETATVLWDALESFPSAEALCSLLVDARPEISPADGESLIGRFLEELAAAGLVVRQVQATP